MNAPERVPQEPEVTIEDLAREAVSACKGDVIKAAKWLEDLSRRRPPVWMTITEPLLSKACYDSVRAACQQQRRRAERSSHLWLAPNYDKGGNGDRVIDHAMSLLDWPLPGGKPLRDATHDDLIAASRFYSKQAATMASTAKWLSAVAEKVTGKKATVADKLDAEELAKLREAAK